MRNEELIDRTGFRAAREQVENEGLPQAGAAGPVMRVRFDDLVAEVAVRADTTYAQVKTDGIAALGLHAAERDAYRIVVNGEVIGNEGEQVNDHESNLDVETLQVTLIKQPTLGLTLEGTAYGSCAE